MPPEEHSVCHVNEQGEFVCPPAELIPAEYDALRTSIAAALPPDLGSNRIDLIVRLAIQVINSPLGDSCVGTRSSDAVECVRYSLDEPAPVMSLYRYSRLPGNILAAYYVQQGRYNDARLALDHWSTIKPSC